METTTTPPNTPSRAWVRASQLCTPGPLADLIKRVEGQARRHLGKYERFVWNVEGVYQGIGTYNTLYVQASAPSLESIFGVAALVELSNHPVPVTAHLPWSWNEDGSITLRVRFSDASLVAALVDGNEKYGYKVVTPESETKIAFSLVTNTYANYPEGGHFGISLKVVSPVQILL
jgi:hypothetical protein